MIAENEVMQDEISENEQDDGAFSINVIFESFSTPATGAFKFKFSVPTSELPWAVRSTLLIDREIIATVKITDDEGKSVVQNVGLVHFHSLSIKSGGDSTLTLIGNKLEDMYVEGHHLQRLIDRNMMLSLRERIVE